MAYTKTVWVNNKAPAINATNLNKIEQGIEDAQLTKAGVEAVLTGEINTHTHAGGGGLSHPQILARNLGC